MQDLSSVERLAELRDEQAALRRIATLVAQEVPPAELFAAVAQEVHQLLQPDMTALHRLDPDGLLTVIDTLGHESDIWALGSRWQPGIAAQEVADLFQGSSVRTADFTLHKGTIADVIRAERIVDLAISPIMCAGGLCGVFGVASRRVPLPPGTERRLGSFTELLSTAIANAESRAELMASRARIAAAADGTRKRIQRDLHDGAQQLVVALRLRLKALATSDEARDRGLDGELASIAEGLDNVLEELRELSTGLHPAVLSKGGLELALKTLRNRSAVPVTLDLRCPERLPERVETTAYYFVAETLTNAAKHAHASRIDVAAAVQEGVLRVCVRDDGVGDAHRAGGSGLVGLRDRVEALGGTMSMDSPRAQGTTVVMKLPLVGPAPPSAGHAH